MNLRWGATEIQLVRGDITDQDVDVVVNAANSTLLGGTGVDQAIHSKGGPQILKECEAIRASRWLNGLPTGMAVMTGGGKLRARHVIHTGGPIWSNGLLDEPKLLADCYLSCLTLCNEERLESIAFPAISTGAFGYPLVPAASIALNTVRRFAEERHPPGKVVFVLFNEDAFSAYENTAKQIERSHKTGKVEESRSKSLLPEH